MDEDNVINIDRCPGDQMAEELDKLVNHAGWDGGEPTLELDPADMWMEHRGVGYAAHEQARMLRALADQLDPPRPNTMWVEIQQDGVTIVQQSITLKAGDNEATALLLPPHCIVDARSWIVLVRPVRHA